MCEKCGDDNCKGSDNYIDPIDVIAELYPDNKFFYLDDYKDAIIGISNNKLVYSKSVIIEILINENKMTTKKALEYYTNNIENGFFGEKTPIFLNDDVRIILDNFYNEYDNGINSIGYSLN